MRILIVKTVPGELPIKNLTYNIQQLGLAFALHRAGHICDIMCCTVGEYKENIVEDGQGLRLICYYVPATIILKNGFPHKADSLFEKYDILLAGEYNQIFAWHLAKKYKEKVVVWHGPYFNAFNRRYNTMCRVFDMFFLQRYRKLATPFMTKSILATEFLQNKGLSNITTIGVDINMDALNQREWETSAFANKIDDFQVRYKLLYIGKIEPRRNCLFLIDVLENVRDKGYDAGLIIVGRGKKDYVDTFFEHIWEKGLGEYILYQDVLEQKYLKDVYEKSNIFLLPTIYDIFGMVLLETMYFGTPCITSANGGSKTLINDRVNGRIIQEFDVEEWGEAVIELISDEKLRADISNAGRKTILEGYTWDELVKKMIPVYEGML